jgi:hypothetical protein
MALRLACDLDGTLADMDTALWREACRIFGTQRTQPDQCGGENEVTASASAALRTLSDHEFGKLWDHVRRLDNFWTTLAEIEPGAIGRLAGLAAQQRWDVIFLTQRPASSGETSQVQSQRWLARHGFPFPSVYVVSGSRGDVARALQLDAVIDDNPDNCVDVVANSKAQSFLVWRDDRATPGRAAELGITVTASITETLTRLTAMSPEPPGLLRRLRAAIRS